MGLFVFFAQINAYNYTILHYTTPQEKYKGQMSVCGHIKTPGKHPRGEKRKCMILADGGFGADGDGGDHRLVFCTDGAVAVGIHSACLGRADSEGGKAGTGAVIFAGGGAPAAGTNHGWTFKFGEKRRFFGRLALLTF